MLLVIKNEIKKFNLMEKKIFYFLAMTILSGIVIACDRDDNGNNNSNAFIINATVENSNSYNDKITTVKAFLYSKDKEYVDVGTGTWKNGGFTLKFSTTVPDWCLWSFDNEDFNNLNISDPKVKFSSLGDLYIVAYDKAGINVCTLYLEGKNGNIEACVYYIYSDRICAITSKANSTYNEVYNVSLKKGWNIVYRYNGSETKYNLTNQPPQNVSLKWVTRE
jgi:hypothetical protein